MSDFFNFEICLFFVLLFDLVEVIKVWIEWNLVFFGLWGVLFWIFLKVLNFRVRDIVLFNDVGCVNCICCFIFWFFSLLMYCLIIIFLWSEIGMVGNVWLVSCFNV